MSGFKIFYGCVGFPLELPGWKAQQRSGLQSLWPWQMVPSVPLVTLTVHWPHTHIWSEQHSSSLVQGCVCTHIQWETMFRGFAYLVSTCLTDTDVTCTVWMHVKVKIPQFKLYVIYLAFCAWSPFSFSAFNRKSWRAMILTISAGMQARHFELSIS